MSERPPLEILSRLREAGFRLTEPRRAVIRALTEASDWLSHEQIHKRATTHCPTLGLVTVYRTVSLLSNLGYVRRVHLDNGCHGYMRTDLIHGHLLVCRDCQYVVEFPGVEDISGLIVDIMSQTGFVVEDHMLELLGRCPACQGVK